MSERENLSILVLDDEAQVGIALEDLFENDFRVIRETTPERAIQTLKHDDTIATILCDQRMPEMRGDQFLAMARDHSPATRMLMTGYADLDSVVRAVNEGQIFGYVSKPWDPEGLRLSVYKAVENYTLRRELERERRLLRDLMRHSPDAIAFKDRDLAYVYLNLPEAQLLGHANAADIVGRRAADFLPAPRLKLRDEREQELMRSGKVQLDQVEQVLTPDGSLRWYAANTAPILDERGTVTGLVSITRDVTEQKWNETGLELLLNLTNVIATAESFDEAMQRSLSGIAVAMGWDYAEVWRPENEGRAVLELSGITHGENELAETMRLADRRRQIGPGEGMLGRVWRDRQPTLVEDIAELPAGHLPAEVAKANFRALLAAPIVSDWSSGKVDAIMAFYSSMPMSDVARLPKLIGSIANGVARVLVAKQAQDGLRQSEQQFRALVEGSIQGILIQRGGVPLFANSAAARIFGHDDAAQILALGRISSLIAPADVERLLAYGEARLRGEETPNRYEFRGRRRDGELIWLECLTTVVEWRGETAVLATLYDITEQKRANEALRFSEAHLAAAQRIAKIGSWTWDVRADRVLLSREMARMLGRDGAGELALSDFLDHFHEADRGAIRAAMAEARRGASSLSFESRIHGPGDEVRHVAVEGEATVAGNGEAELMVGTVHDVTDSRRLHEQLRQSQKMEAVGQLTGGVAHDFNNLLTVMMGNLQLMRNRIGDDERLMRWMDTAERAATRGADLTKRLLAFSRQQVLEEKPTDVNEVVTELEELFRRTLGGAVEIECLLAADCWITKVDPGELENALLNLVVNARDAMGGRGKLTIETDNVTLDEAYARQHFEAIPGDYVMLAVSDTGCGIPEATLEHIFVPFFTTKEAGKGTGLGMSMVYGFIKQSKGNIEIYSEVDQGTTVKIYLPRLPGVEVAAAIQAEPAMGERAAPAATVLVVEDEADLRETLVAILESLGYETLEAADGVAALEVLELHPEVHVLFTDYIMPNGIDGQELAGRARAMRPGLKVLLTSGYTRRAVLRREELGQDTDWIGKPYRRDDIARKLAEMLD